MRAPDWSGMKRDIPCGCNSRKYIMWEAGNTGLYAALAMAAGVAVIFYVAIRKG